MSLTRRDALAGLTATAFGAGGMARGQEATKRPNVLLLFPDQWRYDWTSRNPTVPIRTPNLDRIAARGVAFRQAVSAAPICSPSRACLASGLEYDRARTASNAANYPLAQTTFYTRLRDSGYYVAGCGKMDLAKNANWWGVDGKWRIHRWGFTDGVNSAGKWDQVAGLSMNDGDPPDPYTAFLKKRGLLKEHLADYAKRKDADWGSTFPTPLPDDAYGDNWITDNALRLLNAAPTNKPWFLQVNWAGPHEPEDITRRMEATVRGRTMPPVNGEDEFDAAKNQLIRQNYTAMCENIDRNIGLLFDRLAATGQIDNTLIVFASDHGEMLGDHGLWGKSVPYQPSIGVPLMVCGPGVVRGRRSEALVSLIDVGATLMDYAGVSTEGLDARSFRQVLEGRTDHHRRVVYTGLGGWRAAWDGRYKVILGYSEAKGAKNDQSLNKYDPALVARPPIVFDLAADPAERHDIAGRAPPEAQALLAGLRTGAYPG